jgi:dipeptidyl aminopeptidase/acylaminoacyl peptidase
MVEQYSQQIKLESGILVTVASPDKNNSLPCVILLPGFTSTQAEPHIRRLADSLAAKGYASLSFDVRGYGDSEGDPQAAFCFDDYLKDLGQVISFSQLSPLVDHRRIALWGHSVGGLIALIKASQETEIRAVSILSTPQAIDDVQFSTPIHTWRETGWFTKKKGDQLVKISYKFIDIAHQYPIKDYLPKIQCPVQVGWGTKDTRVPSQSTQRLYQQIDGEKSFYQLDIAHDYKTNKQDVQSVNAQVISFINKYLT